MIQHFNSSSLQLPLWQPGSLCLCVVPPDPDNPQALYSDKGQLRPCIVAEVNPLKSTAIIIPGTKNENEWGYGLSAGAYGLHLDTYFHSHEPREVPLHKLKYRPELKPLSPADFAAVQQWRPRLVA